MKFIKIIVLNIMFMSMSQNSLSQDFEVISSDIAKKMMSNHKPVLLKTLENNLLVYMVNKDNFLIYSPLSKYSLLFTDINKLSKLKNMDTYPIGIETDDVRETEQDRVKNISESINDYINELENKFNIKLSSQDLSTLDLLDEEIKEYGLENLSERDIFIITLYLDEIFRRNTEMYWSIEKIYTLKTYWIPFIKSNDGKKEHSFYRTIFKSYLDNQSGYLNLKLNYILELADFKGLKPLSNEHIEFIKSFR